MKIKKQLIIIFIILLLSPSLVLADTKEASKKMNNLVVDALKNKKWNITTSKSNNNVDIKILMGDIDNDADLKQTISDIKGVNKVTVYVSGCKDTSCDYGTSKYTSVFKLKKDGSKIYLTSTNVVIDTYNTYKDGKKTLIQSVTNGVTKNASYTTSNYIDESDVDNVVGTPSNPKIIDTKGTIKVPDQNDDFWNHVGDNKCYYFKVQYDSSKSQARFKINPRLNSASKTDRKYNEFIFYSEDPNKALSTPIKEDIIDDGIYSISKNNVYAICSEDAIKYGISYDFTYYDDKPLNVHPNDKSGIVDELGEDNVNVLTEEEYEEAIKAKSAENGNWNPETLCGQNNENCNIDITEFCNNPQVARTLKFLGILLAFAKILVPALIIVMGFIDLIKIVASGKMDSVKKQAIGIGKRIAIGIVIFILPSLLITVYNVAYNIANGIDENTATDELQVPENLKNCVGCILKANDSNECIIHN